VGKVDTYIKEKLKIDGALHFSLIDPEDVNIESLPLLLKEIKNTGSDAIMVGGSTIVNQILLYDVVDVIKKYCDLPVILFPNNVTGITSNADAIWFMSLFNSINPYFITGAQMMAAPYIKRIGIETLSMAYLIVGEGNTAGFIGYANPIPIDKPEVAAAYALAAEIMGFKYVYLEAGSGAKKHIPPDFVSSVKKYLDKIILVVGGGIRNGDIAYSISKAGADIVVTGNIIIESIDILYDIVDGVKRGGIEKIKGV